VKSDSVEHFRKVCREHRIKVTPQRLEIYKVAIQSKEHPSAEDIYHSVRAKLPTISLDTVYRTLSSLERWGLLFKVAVVDDRSRFDADLSPHHHVICTECNNITDFLWPEFDSLALPEDVTGWGSLKLKASQFVGVCSKCDAKNKNKVFSIRSSAQ
jgi:Fur family peroxide stress response transcriptional regulator